MILFYAAIFFHFLSLSFRFFNKAQKQKVPMIIPGTIQQQIIAIRAFVRLKIRSSYALLIFSTG